MMIEAAIEGVGIAIGSPYYRFASEIAKDRLHQPFPLTVPNGKSCWQMVPEPARESPRVRAFRDWMMSEVAASPEARLP